MKDQHKLIKGYRELSQEEIDLMNRAKTLAAEVGGLIEELERYSDHAVISPDRRWVAIAKTDLQKGFMSLVRSIAQPTTF